MIFLKKNQSFVSLNKVFVTNKIFKKKSFLFSFIERGKKITKEDLFKKDNTEIYTFD